MKPTQRVIDGDTKQVVAWFHKEYTGVILAFYKSLGRWKEVHTNHEGDIILYQ